jgi:hypothetical protein
VKPAPYPADTRAKGWRFELDLERVRQSDTWARAGAPLRPWLLMLWAVAWEQTPCGSLPDDDESLAGKLDMPLKQFKAARERLLRGWTLADDGRLYHGTLTERVLEMVAYRQKEAARRAGNRGKHADDAGSPEGVPRDNTANPDTGTGTGTIEAKASKARKRASFDPLKLELPEWLPPEAWAPWCQDRRARGKPISEAGAKAQIAKLEAYRAEGHSPRAVIEHSIAGGYQGLFAPAMKPQQAQPNAARTHDDTKRLFEKMAEQAAASVPPPADLMRRLGRAA